MKKYNEITVNTYFYKSCQDSDLFIDIVKNDNNRMYEAYIYAEDYSVKMYMYGLMQDTISYNDFLENVECNAEEYLILYVDEYLI